ncbi:holin [Mycobacterium phage TChen]|uniref:Holin n=2 Tax=Gracegardnervirinae TaxID=2946632 RepID=A0A2P1JR56_9CAUD|nr:holin [Mycobacterium phage TChen]YP_009963631.1 holin [Mycobacterium phage MooMoo]AVO21636.1 holin [Mycobacterium phage MooMoo]AWH14433.1 hypothetical protein SEA_TCHEN_32 [Mycobacterium phage TChen]
MSDLFTRRFWEDALERIVSSAAQGFIVGGGVGTATATSVDVRYFPWIAAASTAGGMAVMTFAKCLAAIKVGNKGTASLLAKHDVDAT